MGLKLTLRPNEQIIVNGCAIRNTGRTHALHIESRADVIRGKDLLDPKEAVTPVSPLSQADAHARRHSLPHVVG